MFPVAYLSYIAFYILSGLSFVFLIFLTGVGKQGKPLQSDARQMVINVHKFCTEEYDALKVGKPTISVADITGRTAAATGVSRRTVYRILDEKKKSDVAGCVLSTPRKKKAK